MTGNGPPLVPSVSRPQSNSSWYGGGMRKWFASPPSSSHQASQEESQHYLGNAAAGHASGSSVREQNCPGRGRPALLPLVAVHADLLPLPGSKFWFTMFERIGLYRV